MNEIAWSLNAFGSRLLVTTALNAGGVLISHFVNALNPKHPIYFIDTGVLPQETYAYYKTLCDRGFNIVKVGPDLSNDEFNSKYGQLWEKDPDKCCNIKKVTPLDTLKTGKIAWLSSLRREQGGERKDITTFELNGGMLKIYPFAYKTRKWIDDELKNAGIPQHPLYNAGYKSIGCEHCTAPSNGGERDGRWVGNNKTECGIHKRNG